MFILSILIYLLIILSFLFVFLLYKKLLTWNYQYKIYLETIKKGRQNNRENEHPLIGKLAPDFEAISKRNNKKIKLENLSQDNLVLIFLDSSCIYCDHNLELFLNETRNYPSIRFAVVMNEGEMSEADALFNLYEMDVEVLIVKEQTFIDYQIKFWPSFVHINKTNMIQNITPIPTFIFQEVKTA